MKIVFKFSFLNCCSNTKIQLILQLWWNHSFWLFENSLKCCMFLQIEIVFICFYLTYGLFPFFFFFVAVLGFELRAYSLSHSTSHIFVMGVFRDKVSTLFAQAGFKPWSSCSLPPEYLGLQYEPPEPSQIISFYHHIALAGLSDAK
jgi:hypothetical protein